MIFPHHRSSTPVRNSQRARRSAAQSSTSELREDECRIGIRFRGQPTLHYRALREVAERFAAAMRLRGVAIDIDTRLSEGLRPLPCERLWTS
ncbi:hypothetical protein J2W56_001084 [Nocardia kruczakiae]|uniref:Uncharacterized protein n=1 Tax=Nocardia kruczakiae TaxID=261477 RepID=A0ABU1XBB1_9NOCA|nr:hypothetical protein [Nocardia kruczakiae]